MRRRSQLGGPASRLAHRRQSSGSAGAGTPRAGTGRIAAVVVTGRGAARRRLLPRGYGFAVAGIAVGMAGLVALGALADRISRFIDGGHRFVLGQISVAGAGIGTGAGFTAGGLLPRRTIEAIRRVPGVALVQAQVMLPFNPGTSTLFSVNQELILGVDLGVPGPNRNYPSLPRRPGERSGPPGPRSRRRRRGAGRGPGAPSGIPPPDRRARLRGRRRARAAAHGARPVRDRSDRGRPRAVARARPDRQRAVPRRRDARSGGPQHGCGGGLGRRRGSGRARGAHPPGESPGSTSPRRARSRVSSRRPRRSSRG